MGDLIPTALLYLCMQSEQLESVLKDLYGGEEDLLLGELQFAFIAFLVYVHINYP